MQWFIENWGSILEAATAVVAAASLICALTPTPTDDSIVKKIYSVLEWLALNIGKAKQ